MNKKKVLKLVIAAVLSYLPRYYIHFVISASYWVNCGDGLKIEAKEGIFCNHLVGRIIYSDLLGWLLFFLIMYLIYKLIGKFIHD